LLIIRFSGCLIVITVGYNCLFWKENMMMMMMMMMMMKKNIKQTQLYGFIDQRLSDIGNQHHAQHC